MLANLRRVEKSYWLLVVPLLHMTMPWLQYRLRMIVPFCCMILWLLLCNKHSRVCFSLGDRNRMLGCFLVAFFTMGVAYFLKNLYAVFGHGDLMTYYDFAGAIMNLMCIIVLYVILSRGKIYELRFLMLVEICGIIASGILAMVGMSMGLEGARTILAGRSEIASYEMVMNASDAYQLGLGGYGFIYEMAFSAGAFLYGALQIKSKFLKCVLFVACVSCCVCIRGSGLGTPIFVLAMSIGTALLSTLSRRRIWAITISFCAIMLLLSFVFSSGSFLSFAAKPMSSLAEGMQDGSIKNRVRAVAEAMSGNQDSYARTRYGLQYRSWGVFVKHPVFGIGHYNWPHPTTYEIGGHSFMFDRLGQQGLVGFMFVILMFIGVWHYFKVMSRTVFGYSWLVMEVIAVGGYVFAAIANPVNYLPVSLFLLIPGIATYFKDFRLGRPIIYSNRKRNSGGR